MRDDGRPAEQARRFPGSLVERGDPFAELKQGLAPGLDRLLDQIVALDSIFCSISVVVVSMGNRLRQALICIREFKPRKNLEKEI